jgi:hypothetical protein
VWRNNSQETSRDCFLPPDRLRWAVRAVAMKPSRRTRRLFSRVRLSDDDADGVLVETFEAAFALEIFEVAADRAFAGEFVELFLRDRTICAQLFGSLLPNSPARLP